MFIDSHCHLDKLKISPQEALSQAQQAGVSHFLCVGVSLDAYPRMRDKTESFSNVYRSVGVHPLHDDLRVDADLLRQFAKDDKVIAIGETGLDYFYAKETKAEQRLAFETQAELAVELNKPVIIHTRDAREDTLAIIRDKGLDKPGGVLHCFTESWEMAKAAIDMGFYISISGIVTFRNADELRDVVRKLPLDRLLIETDSPYLAPVPHRGKENQPAYVKDVAQFIASLKSVSVEQLAQQTSDNFFALFSQANA